MTATTQNARVTGPVPYIGADGATVHIPTGPCMLQQLDGQLVDVIWGPDGEESTVLRLKDVETAEINGNLVLLD